MYREFAEKIKWLGHDGFRLETGKTIYIDPYEVGDGPAADIILVTHVHFDHCSPDDIAKLKGPDTVIVTEKESAQKIGRDAIILKPGDSIELAGIRIEAVPAYNLDKKYHPKENGWLGFVLELEGVRVYHAGDTDFIPEMENLEVDIALLPVSGTYVMTAAEAVEAARVIKPKIAIPMHYGAIVGDASDADVFKSELENEMDVIVLEKQ